LLRCGISARLTAAIAIAVFIGGGGHGSLDRRLAKEL
jgi:hypothetical protein